MVPSYQKKKALPQISTSGRRQQCEWGRSAGQSAPGVKLTVCLWPSISVSLTISIQLIMTHMGLKSNPVNVQSLMHALPMPMLEHAKQQNGRPSRQSCHSPLYPSPCSRCSPSPYASSAGITTISCDARDTRAHYVQSSLSTPSSPSVSANVFSFSGGPFFGSSLLSYIQFSDLHLLPPNVA